MKNAQIITRERHFGGSAMLRASSETRLIEGMAIVFNQPSEILWEGAGEEMREVIDPSAVPQELLDSSDIKMTLYHDDTRLLARSNKGAEGSSLTYALSEEGVSFRFEAPNTPDGDTALELVRRGIISGCSFKFCTYYEDESYVSRETARDNGKRKTTCRVNRILSLLDFTLTPDPAYPQTQCSARDLARLMEESQERERKARERREAQLSELRQAAKPRF